jgi:predicted DNA-binding transcriptional regulator YafY
VELLRNKRISLSVAARSFDCSERSIERDEKHLKNIGEAAGFRLSNKIKGDYYELLEFRGRSRVESSQQGIANVLAEMVEALGAPIADLATGLDVEAQPEGERFLHIVMPQLVEGSSVAKVAAELEAAWKSSARVEFSYRDATRRVEPAAAIVKSGRWYLIARDAEKKGTAWRTFSMDLITGKIRRVGSFTRKKPPAQYLASDTIGFIKREGDRDTVEVTLSKEIAASAISRIWQQSQEVQKKRDGSAVITFHVGDVDEVIRWALGYGDQAWVSGPPAAVERAREIVASLQKRYGH